MKLQKLIGIIVCAVLASVYIYPIFSGLILLPLDLLVSNSGPWRLAGQILLKNAYMQDSVLQMFPWRHLTFTSLTHGTIPLWNPFQFMGTPFLASMKSAVFYPGNILYLFFGEVASWNILLWLQLFLSLWFTYLLLGSLGVGAAVALFSAVAFAFNSLMVSVLEFGSEGHVLLWLPVLLYFVKRYVDERRPWYLVGLAAAVASSIFAGQLQYFVYLAAVVVAFALWYASVRHATRTELVMMFLGILLGGLIAAVQLLPGIAMFGQSYRGIASSYTVFAGGLIRPQQLLRLLSPDWFGNPVTLDLHSGYIEQSGYMGIIPLFFALYAVFSAWKRPFVRFFGMTAVAALLFSMDGIAQIVYFLRIPIISSGYGSRLFSMVLFSGAVLAGLGLREFLRNNGIGRIRAVLVYAGAVLFLFGAGVVVSHWNSALGVSIRNIKIEFAVLIAFTVAALVYEKLAKTPARTLIFVVFTIFLTFGDLFRMGYRFLTFSNVKFLYPETAVTKYVRDNVQQSLGRAYGLTEPEVDTALGIAGVETYNPLFPLRTATVLQALENRRGEPFINNKYYLAKGPRTKTALDFLGVTYVVVPKGVNPALSMWNDASREKDITKVFSDDTNDVYVNTTAYPRFALFYDVKPGTSDEDALRELERQRIDFQKTVLIRENIAGQFTEGSGSAALVSAELNRLSFRVTTTEPAIFYLSDAFDSGWRASVNGRSEPVYRANYNFRAVAVPKGESVVTFWYLPRTVVWGAVLSAVGIVGTLLLPVVL